MATRCILVLLCLMMMQPAEAGFLRKCKKVALQVVLLPMTAVAEIGYLYAITICHVKFETHKHYLDLLYAEREERLRKLKEPLE